MCTMIVQQVEIDGSGKGTSGWFPVRQANVSYDHPFNAPLEHALNIDFVNEAQGPGARVAVELSAASARTLVETILAVLARAEAGGHLEEPVIQFDHRSAPPHAPPAALPTPDTMHPRPGC